MPTASPSMIASMGVVDETVAKAVERKISVIASATPIRALTSGNHATTSERKVTISTNSATSTPITSTIESAGSDVENRSPPTATCDPSGRAARSDVDSSSRAVLVEAGTSVTVPSNCRRMSAAWPSSDTMPLTVSPNGSVTASTPSSVPRLETAVPISPR